MNATAKKTCLKCGNEKSVLEFSKNKNRADGLWCYCKSCKSQSDKEYQQKNKEKIKLRVQAYCQEHRPEARERAKQYKSKNKDKIKQYRREHKEEIKRYQDQYNKQYHAEHKAEHREYRRKNSDRVKRWRKKDYQKHRDGYLSRSKRYYAQNRDEKRRYAKEYYGKNYAEKIKPYCAMQRNKISYKIIHNIRNRIYKLLRGGAKSKHTIDLLGCSVKEFKRYIEKQFLRGMSWENYGSGIGKWNLDHVIPCAFFQITDLIEQQQCFHYTNHQPLWERGENGNLQKNDRTQGLNLLYRDPTPFLR